MKETFDTLYEEGAETPKLMNVGLHCRIVGQPGRANGLDRFIAYAKSHPNVWFAGRAEIARTWLDQFPPGARQRIGTEVLAVLFGSTVVHASAVWVRDLDAVVGRGLGGRGVAVVGHGGSP